MIALRRSALTATILLLGFAAPARAVDAYVDRFFSFTQGATVGIGVPVQAFGATGPASLEIGPVAVDPSIIVGAPGLARIVSVGLGQQAVYGFASVAALQGITVFTVGDGDNEQAQVFGRLGATDPWTLIGTVFEPPAVPGSVEPIPTTLSLAGTGLAGVRQVLVFGLDNGGGLPGYDLMGIQGNGVVAVPEPATGALALAGLGLMAWLANRRRPRAMAAPSTPA